MYRAYLSAVVIELVGIVLVSGGIVFEYLSGEPIGFVVINVGIVIVAVGSLLYAKIYRHLGKLNVSKNKNNK